MKDPYATLGVERNADEKTIKAKFHKLALEKHPDRNKDPNAEEEFKDISAAYDILSDPKKRQQYDQFGDLSSVSQSAPHIDLNEVLRQAGFNFGADGWFGGGRRNKQSVFKGDDLHKQIRIDFMEAVKGCKKTIKVSYTLECDECEGTGAEEATKFSACKNCGGAGKTGYTQGFMQIMSTCRYCRGTGRKIDVKCKACNGSGQKLKEDKLNINIPSGIEEDVTMRLSGKGLPGLNGGPAGDLFVSISINPHPKFKRRGPNIYAEESIDYLDALLGIERIVETVNGSKKLRIPPLTQHGMILKLGGQGIGAGDHYVSISVRLPTKLTDEEKELLQKLRSLRC